MKCIILALMLIVVSEATQSKAELTPSTLPSVPQWYVPCRNREGRPQNQRFVKKLTNYCVPTELPTGTCKPRSFKTFGTRKLYKVT